MRRLWLAGAALALLHGAAPAGPPAGDAVLARAGTAFITEAEFRERFELLPGLYRRAGGDLAVTKLEFLYALAAEKLLVQEALERGLDRDPLVVAFLENVRLLLARDQLYREEVRGRVEVTPREISAAMRQAPVLLHAEYLFFEREEDARFVAGRIRSARDFDRMVPDSSLAALRDTATVIWGDAAEEIEAAAYALSGDDVSPPVRSGGGWYILRVLSRSPRPDYQGLDPAAVRERVTEAIRSRREFTRMHEVLRGILSRSTGYAKPAAVRILGSAVQAVLAADSAQTADSLLTLGAEGAARVRAACAAHLADTLAVADATVWTVEDGISLLVARRFAVPRHGLRAATGMLNDELEFRVHQELLALEALRRGLDQRPDVRRRLELWRDACLADAMKRRAQEHVSLTDAEVAAYERLLDSSAAPSEVNLRILRTPTLEQMQDALAEIEAGRSFEDVARERSADDALRAAGGVTGFFPITERQPLGELAGGRRPGERFGPVHTGEGYVTFEVLDRRDPPDPSGTRRAARDTLARDLRAMKQQGLLNRFLARSAALRGVDVYQDRLDAVEVSAIPMMTFRLLGFGGRMFEVPFVDPQIQWLRIPPPGDPVLP